MVDFKYTSFKENASFRAVSFNKGINLARINTSDSAILDFYYANINDSGSELEVIPTKEKQETHRVLKHESLKKNDTIKAIEYYKVECEYHYQSLSWRGKDFFNKLILWFEKWSSGYGTEVFRAISFFLIINILFFILSVFFSIPQNSDKAPNIINAFFSTLMPIGLCMGHSIFDIPAWLKVLHFVVNATLIYEIIKSFRKYSRKL